MMKLAVAGAVVIIAASASQLPAQEASAMPSSQAASAWSLLAGCWSAAAAVEDAPAAGTAVMLCVLPVEDDRLAADFVSFEKGQEIRRSRIVADGVRRDFGSGICAGRESARFSLDGAQVLLSGEIRCDSQTDRRTSGIISLTEAGRLLQVSGGDESRGDVRFRYHQRVAPDVVPEPARALLSVLAAPEAPYGTGLDAAFSTSSLTDLASAVSVPVTEIWLAAIAADAASPVVAPADYVQALADAGVPDRVRTLLVALADPAAWRVSLTSSGATVWTTAYGTERSMRQIVDAYGGGASIAPGGSQVGRANGIGATSIAVANACLGAVLLTDGAFGAAGGAPAFAHVLFARACPNSALYDPRFMNAVMYGAYGGSGGGVDSEGNPVPRKSRDSGHSGDGTTAADIARERNAGGNAYGGASQGRASSHPPPDPIPLGGLRGPVAAPAPSAPAVVRPPDGSPRVPVP